MMSFMNDVAPWILTFVGISGFYFVQNGHKITGWSICLVNQIMWLTYSIATQQWGFIASVPFYSMIYIRGIRKSIKEPSH